MDKHCKDLDKSVQSLGDKYVANKQEVETLKLRVKNLEDENTELNLTVDSHEKRLDDLESAFKWRCKFYRIEQYGRRDILRVDGLALNHGEITDNAILRLAGVLGVKRAWCLELDDIARAHFSSKAKDGKPPQILVKFVSYKK